jgi:hypothetical protein
MQILYLASATAPARILGNDKVWVLFSLAVTALIAVEKSWLQGCDAMQSESTYSGRSGAFIRKVSKLLPGYKASYLIHKIAFFIVIAVKIC